MSFNFSNFMAAMAKILPAVGETVIALHPNNPNEALKIQVGTQLISAIAASLHQSATAPNDAPAPPDAVDPNVQPSAIGAVIRPQ